MLALDALPIERLALAAALALTIGAAVAAWTASGALKRLACLVLAQIGAVLAAAALGAAQAAAIAGIAVAFAQLAVGAALVVRLQEDYGGVDVAQIDSADAADDVPEQAQ